MKIARWLLAASSASLLAVAVACGSGGSSSNVGGGTTNTTGQACSAASQCYPLVSATSPIKGTVTCVTQGVPNGYCTHTCTQNSDCCAVPGECPAPDYPEVCASYQSTGQTYCFLSCDPSAIAAAGAGTTDPNTYCQLYAGPNFTCHSTGGGSQNQKFCGP